MANTLKMWESGPNYTAEQLGGITVPMLILDGDSDGLIYTEHTIEMAGLIPGATLTLIPGLGEAGRVQQNHFGVPGPLAVSICPSNMLLKSLSAMSGRNIAY